MLIYITVGKLTFFSFDSYVSHPLTCNCANIRPQSDFFTGFHTSLMYCKICVCTKGQFSTKMQFYDFIYFMSIVSMFVANLEQIGPSSRTKDTKYHCSLTMAKNTGLNSPDVFGEVDLDRGIRVFSNGTRGLGAGLSEEFISEDNVFIRITQ